MPVTAQPPPRHKSLLEELYDPKLSYWDTNCPPLDAGFCGFSSAWNDIKGAPSGSSPPGLTDRSSSSASPSDGWDGRMFAVPTPSRPPTSPAPKLEPGTEVPSLDFGSVFNMDEYYAVPPPSWPGLAPPQGIDWAQLPTPAAAQVPSHQLPDPFHALPQDAVWPKQLGI